MSPKQILSIEASIRYVSSHMNVKGEATYVHTVGPAGRSLTRLIGDSSDAVELAGSTQCSRETCGYHGVFNATKARPEPVYLLEGIMLCMIIVVPMFIPNVRS